MNIQEMHVVFRTLGQQMGMQVNRTILSESIDIFINNAILNKVKNELNIGSQTNIILNGDIQSTSMGVINSLKSLYKTTRISIDDIINPNGNLIEKNTTNGYHIINIKNINPMMIFGFSIEYDDNKGNAIDCRLLGSDVLENTLHDYCNSASKDYPIVCYVNEQVEIFTNTPKCDIKFLNIKYLKYPNVVDYKNEINCDLPDYLHYEIIEDAVNKFYNSVNANYNKQQKE